MATGWTNEFMQQYDWAKPQIDPNYQLTAPQLGNVPAPSLGNYQLSVPTGTAPAGPSTDYSSLAGAGITAAGSAASGIAQAAAAQAVRDRIAQMNDANRASSLTQAKMSLAAQAEMAQKDRLAAAQQYLRQILQGNANNAFDSRDTQRASNQGISSAISGALLHR